MMHKAQPRTHKTRRSNDTRTTMFQTYRHCRISEIIGFLPIIGVFILLTCSCTTNAVLVDEPEPPAYRTNEPIRSFYGSSEHQFGDLRLPEGAGPFPVIAIVHGGCWRSQFRLTLMDSMATDLTKRGFATWNIEYRRTEDPGGGWPGTFTDVAKSMRHLATMTVDYPLDTTRLAVAGHSAGGHLALWLGAYNGIEVKSELYIGPIPPIRGIVSLAGITDLAAYLSPSGCGSNVVNLMGGLPDQVPERYAEASPIQLAPLGVRQVLINGEDDNIVTVQHITPYLQLAKAREDEIDLIEIPGAGHFEVITPGSVAWSSIVKALEQIIR